MPSESVTLSETASDLGPEPVSASALVVAEPTFTVLPEPISVTAESITTLNGSPVREMVPHEEASRIIEAVLAHVSSQRRELGVVMHETRHPAPKTEERAADVKPAAAMVTAVEKDAEAKPAESTLPEDDESKAEGKPVNFVRRWFVGRSQS